MNNVPWYVQQRAESLAVVFLTREPGVEVSKEQGLDFGLNYKLILDRDDASEWVGVQLQAVDSTPPARLPWQRPGLSQRYFDRLEVPLFLLVVNAKTEDRWVAWIKEPIVDNGEVKLLSHMVNENLPLSPIDAEGYRRLLADCRAYFQAGHGAGAA